MFDIGWPELLIVAIVLVVIVGPKDLPRMLRTFGKTTNKLRSMAGDFRRQFDDALKEAELDDVKSVVSDVRKLDPTAEIKKQLNPMKKMGEDIQAGLDAALKPTPKTGEAAKSADAAADAVAKVTKSASKAKAAATGSAAAKATSAAKGSAAPKAAATKKAPAAKKAAPAKKPAPAKKAVAKKTPAKRAKAKSAGAAG